MGQTARKEDYQPALDRFYDALPTKPYCGDMKPAYLIRSKRHALRWNYIQASPPGLTAWLTFDIDHANCWIWEEAGLPAPNLIVRDRTTNTSHISYAIVPVCTSRNGRSHPQRYMEAIRKAFAGRLNADSEYTGRITKNPFSPYWETTELHSAEYSLGELAESVDLDAHSPAPLALVADESHCAGRNSILFQRLRFWAYPQVNGYRDSGTYQEWLNRVHRQAEQLNDFRDTEYESRGALGVTEIDATSRSVARWTWDHYQAPQARGVMQLQDADIDLTSKQRLAARRTHQLRHEATTSAVRDAIDTLTTAGERVSKTAVARLTGLSRQHISGRYSHIFEERATQADSVAYGVYQISAPQGSATLDLSDVRSDEAEIIATPPVSDVDEVTKDPRSGRVSANDTQFKHLCSLLASMARIARLDGAPVQLSYPDRGRLARCLLAQALSPDEAEMIALDVSARFVEPQYRHMTIHAWIGYVVEYARKLKQEKLHRRQARNARFDAYLRGDAVEIRDSELEAIIAYKNELE